MADSQTIAQRTESFGLGIIVIKLIEGYKIFFSPLLHQLLGVKSACRSNPTCSEYAIDAITRYGIAQGMVLSVRRFVNCQPFFNI